MLTEAGGQEVLEVRRAMVLEDSDVTDICLASDFISLDGSSIAPRPDDP